MSLDGKSPPVIKTYVRRKRTIQSVRESLDLGKNGYEHRFRGRTGPSIRVTEGGIGRIHETLLAAASGVCGNVFTPKLGVDFDSAQEAFDFYNMHSWEIGFGIRYGRSYINTSGYTSRLDIECACSGVDNRTNRARTIRTGCAAMIRLHRTDDDGWYISRVHMQHNHAMSVGCGEKRQWRSHSRIDPLTRELIQNLRMNNVSITKVWSIVSGVHGSPYSAPFRKQDVRSVCAAIAHESMDGDMRKTLEVFAHLRRQDDSFVYEIDVDDMGRLRSLFWCDGYSRLQYGAFGDAVTFDTTYRTNLYNMPFGIFVGVNNHFQSIIFGGIFLREETIQAFEWAFRTFIAVMGDRPPSTILTDQCHQMKVAISSTMPGTKHRWCKWHVLRKAKEYIGRSYSKHETFKQEFHGLVSEMMPVPEFERRWDELMTKHNLRTNKYLQRAYHYRAMWAKPFFSKIFCAGMTSTQRSESANHMLKGYVRRSSPMHHFIGQFERLLADRRSEEAREEHATEKVTRPMRFGFPIEQHANTIYTRNIFSKFSNQLFLSGSMVIAYEDDRGSYIVKDPSVKLASSDSFLVRLSPDLRECTCSCGHFDHCGMLCAHLLKVFVHHNVHEIPDSCVLNRWRRGVNPALLIDSGPYSSRGIATSGVMRNAVHVAAVNVIGEAAGLFGGLAVVSRHLEAAAEELRAPKPCYDTLKEEKHMAADGTLFLSPSRIKPKGRPASKRLKSAAESNRRGRYSNKK
ncbi:unnamed protein product [Urochloa decumbens]|uniref:Protein FAR1-RELATED SEQUENCE n=1 Tax=Urochloa decumbens TaxID=240449 RepID=A0ABC9E4K6_9POAL